MHLQRALRRADRGAFSAPVSTFESVKAAPVSSACAWASQPVGHAAADLVVGKEW